MRRPFVSCARAALAAVLLLVSLPSRASSWPRELTTDRGDLVVIYQPRVATFSGATITGHAALSVARTGGAPEFGVATFWARVSVDRDPGEVWIRDVHVGRLRFPGLDADAERDLVAALENDVTSWDLSVSYDGLLDAVRVAERERTGAEGLCHDPPRIVVAERPTVLLVYDGAPSFRDLEEAPFRVAVNTPFTVVADPRTAAYTLSGGRGWWYRANDPLGPWQPLAEVPPDVAGVVARAQAAAGTAAGDAGDDGTRAAAPPAIVTATEPTELIVFEGRPSFAPIDGLELSYATNTESHVLVDAKARQTYVLLAGRWFRADTLASRAWTYVPPEALPRSFARIPPGSPAADVLASVPGTDAAENALLDVEIPQIAAVKRSDARLEVAWDGDPRFVPIEGTNASYARNASTVVLAIDGRFWACADAVWYVSRAPSGPWAVADGIPSDEIERIPPSVPVYNARFVSVYGATDELVWFGYTPGYLWSFPSHGTVVWGTGYRYAPWAGPGALWARPWTWGFGATWSASGWTFGISWDFPFFDVGLGWGGCLRPVGCRDSWRRGRGYWGPAGFRPPRRALEMRLAPPRVGFRPPFRRATPAVPPRDVYGRAPGVVRETPPRAVTRRDAAPPRQGDAGWERREGSAWKAPDRTPRRDGGGPAAKSAPPRAGGSKTAAPRGSSKGSPSKGSPSKGSSSKGSERHR